MDINKIALKATEDLTVKEIKFLKDHLSELSDEVKEKFASVLVEKQSPNVKEIVQKELAEFKKEIDMPSIKNIVGQFTKDAHDFSSLKETSDLEKKAEIFKQWCLGHYTRDFSGYRAIRKQFGVIGKAAMNETDTSAVLPPTEFIAEVERLEETYGVARRFVTVRQSNNRSVTVILGDDDVEVYDTSETGAKTATKLGYDQQELVVRKYAALLPSTDELLEDSAIQIWNDAVTRFARAYSRKEDEIVFTRELGAGSLHPGILHATGVNVIDVGTSITDLTADHLNEAIYGVPTPSAMNGRFFIHRTLLGLVQRLKDEENRYIFQPPTDKMPGTIWGRPYELVEVLPSLADDADSKPFIIYGDLRYSTLLEKANGYKVELFNTGIMDDDEDTEINLLTQDMTTMRVVKRMNARCRFPAAFSVIGTASHIS